MAIAMREIIAAMWSVAPVPVASISGSSRAPAPRPRTYLCTCVTYRIAMVVGSVSPDVQQRNR